MKEIGLFDGRIIDENIILVYAICSLFMHALITRIMFLAQRYVVVS